MKTREIFRNGTLIEVIEIVETPEALTAAVKAEARRRILALAPEWKQANLTARAVELVRKGEAVWTEAETAEVAAIEAVWAAIKAIRAASDILEAEVDAGAFDGDPAAWAGWPA